MCVDTNNRMALMMNLASLEPCLFYNSDILSSLSPASVSTKDALEKYFLSQPEEYVDELEEFISINKIHPDVSCFVFVVCYNELHNINHMVELYSQQKANMEFQVVFLINYTVSENEGKNIIDEDNFQRTIQTLLELKKKNAFIHVVTKRFSSYTGGLSRARKYAMDYSLLSCAKSRNPDAGVLVSNEGDTLKIERDYLYSYAKRIGLGLEYFVQGRITYPESILSSPLLKLYVEVRERVHIGQGQNDHRYPGFEGIMPIGRNYGVHPKIACLSGGIDPVALKGAEDDQMFGFDIYYSLGNNIKKYDGDIALTTNPRRELLIVHGLLSGNTNDAKSMYEDFHKCRDIYDYTWDDCLELINDIMGIEDNQHNRCLVVNQYYQWVMRTVLKNYFWTDSDMQHFITESRCHRMGYWERESKLVDLYNEKLKLITKNNREKFLIFVVNESLKFFNELISDAGSFNKASIDVNSKLIS